MVAAREMLWVDSLGMSSAAQRGIPTAVAWADSKEPKTAAKRVVMKVLLTVAWKDETMVAAWELSMVAKMVETTVG